MSCSSDFVFATKWRFTWEAQSHVPTLRLLLFDSNTNPSIHCRNLQIHLKLSQSTLEVSWFQVQQNRQISLSVPIPRVLVDSESPVNFRALDDYIEVKLVLLLPVNHPIFSSFDSVMDSHHEAKNGSLPDPSKPLVMDSDIKRLSSSGGVHFYCRKCSFKLTSSPLRNFVELPSIEWREVADNWFGACCCSFGGISEKLVTKYANSYKCEQGVCLLSSTSITLCKDDLVEFSLPEKGPLLTSSSSLDTHGGDSYCEKGGSGPTGNVHTIHEHTRSSTLYQNGDAECNHGVLEEDSNQGCHFSIESEYLTSACCNHAESFAQVVDECCKLDLSRTFKKEQTASTMTTVTANQKSFINGFLENIFMVRSSNISEEIKWLEFMCPQCSSVLGAYPCSQGHVPVDSGIRLFKCYISTCLAVGESGNLLRKYTMERMFASQLMEIANNELSFRTVVRDLKTKAPVLHIVLVNPDSWSYSGTCHEIQDSENSVPKIEIQPVIKVLYSDDMERMSAEWARKNSADEVFMLSCQINELINSLISGRDTYPPSYASLQDMILSSLRR